MVIIKLITSQHLKPLIPGQVIFLITTDSNATLNNQRVLSAGLTSGSVIRISGGSFVINNYESIESASSDFVIDIQGTSSGTINNYGVINGKYLIRNATSFDGRIFNEGTLNAGAGTVIDFSSGSALNLINSGIIRGNIEGSSFSNDTFSVDEGLFNGDVTGVENVTVSGESALTGTFSGTLLFENSGVLSTEDLNLNNASYTQSTNSTLSVSLTEENLSQPVITTGSAEFASGSTLSLEPDFYVLSRDTTATYKVLAADNPIIGKSQLLLNNSLFIENTAITGNNNEINVTLTVKDIDDILIDSGLAEDSKQTYNEAVDRLIEGIGEPEKSLTDVSELERWLSTLTGVKDVQQLATMARELKPSTNGSVALLPMHFSRNVLQTFIRRSAARSEGMSYGDSHSNPRFWGMTHFSNINHKSQQKQDDALIRGYEAFSDGLTLGYDLQYENDLLVGAAISYGNSETKKDRSPDKLRIQSYQLSLYSQINWDDWSLAATLTSGLHKNSQQRFYEVDSLNSAKGQFDSQHYGVSLVVDKKWSFADWIIAPQASLNYLTLKVDGYTETGDLNYHYAAQTINQLELGLGVKAGKSQLLGKHLLNWRFSAFVWHDFKAAPYKVKTAYAFIDQANWFTSEGASPDKNRYQINAGLQYSISDQLKLDLAYSYNWSPQWQSNSGLISLKYNF